MRTERTRGLLLRVSERLIVLTIFGNWYVANVSPVRQVVTVPLYRAFLWWMFRNSKRDDIPNVGTSPGAPS